MQVNINTILSLAPVGMCMSLSLHELADNKPVGDRQSAFLDNLYHYYSEIDSDKDILLEYEQTL